MGGTQIAVAGVDSPTVGGQHSAPPYVSTKYPSNYHYSRFRSYYAAKITRRMSKFNYLNITRVNNRHY